MYSNTGHTAMQCNGIGAKPMGIKLPGARIEKCLLGNDLKKVGSNGKRQIAWMEMGRIINPRGIF
jgi:hypothetical protein